ncbi:hypothetical protein UFOVP843_39 [uncultured Caudovirales phage]|uniref:Uncharacterized protein n=1 Tax=uncultured Caudovirales phage TaxID=2100421 RepID=A0A6J5P3W4_9CAUD|nr:hypothetical protein UFOVP843_39 [uncultured Caudovirales phage]CAB4172423.1 hypothetical protein UFOVP936_11 [uncultured Caudovirales phage]
MPDNRCLDYPALAEQMGRTVNWMRNNMGRLRRDHNFPAPIPGFGKRWDPAAIEVWLATHRPAPPTAAGDFSGMSLPSDAPLTDAEFTARLDARAEMMGGHHGSQA